MSKQPITTINLDTAFQYEVIDGNIPVDMLATFLNDQEDNIYLYEYEGRYFITIDCHLAAGIYSEVDQYRSLSEARERFKAICEAQNETRQDNGFDPIEINV